MKILSKFLPLSFCLILGLSIFGFTSCKHKRQSKECSTFEEMKDPAGDTSSDWSGVASGLHASVISTDDKYPKSAAPEIAIERKVKLSGWQGEKVSAQLLLWTAEDVKQVECEFGKFKAKRNTLPASIAQARFVRYVMTDEFGPGCGHRKPENFPASLAPDMLDNLECFNIPAKTVRPVWLTITIPPTAVAGTYTAKLKVYAQNQQTQNFDINLEIIDRLLPEPSAWKYHLDLWQHPSAVARVHNLELWSEAHFEKMKPLMKMLANAGQKVITATLNKDPWNNQCFDAYQDMIVWTRNKNGSWSFDYTVFDKWVQFMMDMGINKMINCYSLLTWNNQLHYKDEAKGKIVTVALKAQSQEYEKMWTVFLKDFSKHLQSKGWLEKTNIAMDERSPEDMLAALEVLNNSAPELGVSLADNHKSYQQYPWIKDICVGIDNKVDTAVISARRENGLITTYYVCCSDKFPNMFTFSNSAESVYAAWYAAACDFDGFLRWAYNSWVENPLTDSRFRTWPAGDTYMVYPDARSSIRFERLVEGIQDVEKIRILRNKYSEENTPESLQKLEILNQTIETFKNLEPASGWQKKLSDAKKILNTQL